MAVVSGIAYFILGYSTLAALAVFSTQYAGPFDVIVKEFADCPNPGIYPAKWTGTKIVKINRTSYKYSSTLYYPETLDDSVKLQLKMAVLGNGGWKDNFFVLDLGSACEALIRYAPSIEKVFAKFVGKCPVAPGTYRINDWVLDVEIKWPSMVYNKYRVEYLYKKRNKGFLCKRVFVDIVPKAT